MTRFKLGSHRYAPFHAEYKGIDKSSVPIHDKLAISAIASELFKMTLYQWQSL